MGIVLPRIGGAVSAKGYVPRRTLGLGIREVWCFFPGSLRPDTEKRLVAKRSDRVCASWKEGGSCIGHTYCTTEGHTVRCPTVERPPRSEGQLWRKGCIETQRKEAETDAQPPGVEARDARLTFSAQ